ncbi:hypothetical protein D3C80_1323810 [compost metagenome]
MLFKNKKKEVVREFLSYVEKELLPIQGQTEITEKIKDLIHQSYELIDYNEYVLAFEMVADELIDNYILLDQKGISLAESITEMFELDKKTLSDLG